MIWFSIQQNKHWAAKIKNDGKEAEMHKHVFYRMGDGSEQIEPQNSSNNYTMDNSTKP